MMVERFVAIGETAGQAERNLDRPTFSREEARLLAREVISSPVPAPAN